MSDNRHLEYLQELPSDWSRIPVEKLGNIFGGGTPSRNEPSFWGSSIAWLTPGELLELEWKCVTKTREYITDLGLTNSSAKLLPPGTVLVTTRATIGSVAVAGIQICTNQGFKNIVLDELNDSFYYYYLLLSLAPEMRRLASGSTFDEISRRDFVSIIVPQPNRHEQYGIATILDTIDSQIQRTKQLIAKLKHQREGLLHDLLTRGLDEDGELRDPDVHPELFKDSELGMVPKEWEIQKLDDTINIIDCKHYTPKYKRSGIPVIRPRNVKIEGLDFSEVAYVSEEEYHLLIDKHKPECGDIVFSRNASFGIPCYVETKQPFAIGQDVVIMSATNVNTRFIYYLLISNNVKKQIEDASSGSTFERINLASIRNLLIPIPTRQEQDRIAFTLYAFYTEINAEVSHLAKLKHYKQGLMHDLLTGRVRVGVGEEQA